MTLAQLLSQANEAYGQDGDLARFYDPITGARLGGHSETLASWVVDRLTATFVPGATDFEQLLIARSVLSDAAVELAAIHSALTRAAGKVD